MKESRNSSSMAERAILISSRSTQDGLDERAQACTEQKQQPSTDEIIAERAARTSSGAASFDRSRASRVLRSCRGLRQSPARQLQTIIGKPGPRPPEIVDVSEARTSFMHTVMASHGSEAARSLAILPPI